MGIHPIEMRPPYIIKNSEPLRNQTVQKCWNTYHSVVRAADGGCVARATAANSDDTDWGAAEAEEGLNRAEHDAEQASEKVCLGRSTLER